jgi:thiol-disulfide isomerase/thioredoxin
MYKKIAVILFCTFLIVAVAFFTKTGYFKELFQPDAEMTLEQALNQKQKLVVADFYATWCGYCKKFAPTLHNLKGEYKDKFIFVSVNGEAVENEKYAKDFYVPVYPTLYLINPTNNNKVMVPQNTYGDSTLLRIEFNRFLSANEIKNQ